MEEPHILQEVADIPDALRRAATPQAEACRLVVAALQGRTPRLLVTIGRGSSDHAATFIRLCCTKRLKVDLLLTAAAVSRRVS